MLAYVPQRKRKAGFLYLLFFCQTVGGGDGYLSADDEQQTHNTNVGWYTGGCVRGEPP